MIPPTNINQPAIVDALEAAINFLSAYRRVVKEMPNLFSVEPVKLSSIGQAATIFKSKQIDPEIVESIKIARIVIVQSGRRLMLDELYTLSRARGLRIPGKNPKGAFGKRLMRHGKRENLAHKQGYGWWPAELPEPINIEPGGQRFI